MYPDIRWQAVGQAVAVVGLCWLLSLTGCAPQGPPLPPGWSAADCSRHNWLTGCTDMMRGPGYADPTGALLGTAGVLLRPAPTAPTMTNCYGTSRSSVTCLSY